MSDELKQTVSCAESGCQCACDEAVPGPTPDEKALEETLDGIIEKRRLDAVDEARKSGLYVEADIRTPLKLPRGGGPTITVAIPIGAKDDPTYHHCPECKAVQTTYVECLKCGNKFSTHLSTRSDGLVPIEFAMCFMQIVPPLLTTMRSMVRKSILSAQAREEMTHAGLAHNTEFFFYWDDDVLIPPKAIMELYNCMLMNPDAAIISGVVSTRERVPSPLIFHEPGKGPWYGFNANSPGVIEEIGVGAGGGCLMVRAQALREVKEILGGPWWADEKKPEGTGVWGHDIRFCERVRMARETGKTSRPWTVNVAGWLQCGHFDVKSQTVYSIPRDSECFDRKINYNTGRYWDYMWDRQEYGEDDAKKSVFSRVLNSVIIEAERSELAGECPERSARIIEVGCGNGVFLDMAAKKAMIGGVGVDISKKAVEITNSRHLMAILSDVGKMEALPPGNVVVSIDTLDCLDDERLDHFLGLAAAVGRAVFAVKCGGVEGAPAGERQNAFTAESFEELLKRRFSYVKIDVGTDGFMVAVCHREKGDGSNERQEGDSLGTDGSDDALHGGEVQVVRGE